MSLLVQDQFVSHDINTSEEYWSVFYRMSLYLDLFDVFSD